MISQHAAPVLTPEDHTHFLEHGYVVLKRVVPPETLAAAIAALEEGAFVGTPGAADYQAVRSQAVGSCMTDRIQDAIAELFGPDYSHTRAQHGDDMPRPFQPNGDWPAPTAHVDDDYPTFMPGGWALGLFIFLTPVQPRGGAFVLFPGSYRRYQQGMSAAPAQIAKIAPDPAFSGAWEEFLAEPGDAVLFHHLMGHAGSNNVSDPQTRHALLSRWHPQRRIVPGGKPLAALSTIEKANSARFQQTHFGSQFAFPALTKDKASVLRDGFAPGDSLLAHDLLHFGGRTHLFFVDAAQATVVQHAQTTNLTDWETAASLPPFREAIYSLALFARGREVLLFATGGSRTYVRVSQDLAVWEDLPMVTNSRAAAGHFSTPYGSKTARGQVLFFLPANAPAQVQCHWSRTWAERDNLALVAEAPSGSGFEDLTVAPTFGEQRFALVADVRRFSTDEVRPFYAVSDDSARYGDPLQPLPFETPTVPQGIRVYARARDYWLVTYRRREAGQTRLFWGVIDWQEEPRLTEIAAPEALQAALETVGMA